MMVRSQSQMITIVSSGWKQEAVIRTNAVKNLSQEVKLGAMSVSNSWLCWRKGEGRGGRKDLVDWVLLRGNLLLGEE